LSFRRLPRPKSPEWLLNDQAQKTTRSARTAKVKADLTISAMLSRRNQFRIRPAEVAKLIESSPQPPMILDVRDRSTYDRSPVRIPNARHVAPDQLDAGMAALTIEPERTVVAYCT